MNENIDMNLLINESREDSPYLGTYTNKKFHFLEPTTDEICIMDIAHSLSNQCRFNGHTEVFYSVAEHCCIISDLVEAADRDRQEVLSGLLHDASEAYLCDIPSPLKPYLTNYMEMERRLEYIIQKKYNILPKTSYIAYYDMHICGEEARQLFEEVPDWVENYHRLPSVKVKRWSPEVAKKEFLSRFYKYGGVCTPL